MLLVRARGKYEWISDYIEKQKAKMMAAKWRSLMLRRKSFCKTKYKNLGKLFESRMMLSKLLYYDGKVDGKRYKTKARYNKCSREEAVLKLTKKQQRLIGELTIDFN